MRFFIVVTGHGSARTSLVKASNRLEAYFEALAGAGPSWDSLELYDVRTGSCLLVEAHP